MSNLSCPVCQGAFKEVLREGILIDVCIQCRGVWLDRGELEKLLSIAKEDGGQDLSAPSLRVEAPRSEPPRQYQDDYRQPRQAEPPRYYKRDDDDDDDYRRHGHHKKKSRFESIFDIFD